MPRKQHYLFLAAIITLSAALRFTGLDSKPLWLDEIITTLFSLGHSFTQVPLDKTFSLAELPNLFTFNSQATCQTIAETVATESTHPPVFFCLLHWWLGRMKEAATLPEVVWYVRSLPAFFGVVTVAAIYYLGRVAFSPNTGLLAAAFMAVSPFAVYLSQEARHYTLPLLLITLALIGLIQIQQDIKLFKPPFESPLAPLGKGGTTVGGNGTKPPFESPLAPLGKGGTTVGGNGTKPPFESPLAPLGKGGTTVGGNGTKPPFESPLAPLNKGGTRVGGNGTKPPFESPLAPLGKGGTTVGGNGTKPPFESPLAPLNKGGTRVGGNGTKPPFESPLAPLGKGGTRGVERIAAKPPFLRGVGGIKPNIWISWVIFNTIGLYIHYFFILALAAQIGAIFLWQMWHIIQPVRKPESFQVLSIIRELISSIWHLAFCILPLILFLPWFPILLEHFNRPETAWFKPFEPSWIDNIVPIYQMILGWILMPIALPVENQPLWIAIPCGILMLVFAIAFGRTLWQKIPKLFTSADSQDSSLILGLFTLFVFLEFLFIVYILGKDITSAVRYHFIYYPSICVLLAACLTPEFKNRSSTESNQTNQPIKKDSASIAISGKFRDIGRWIPAFAGMTKKFPSRDLVKTREIVILGLLSSLFVISGLVFQKPYNPEKVAKHLNLEPEKPLMVMVGYDSFQEVALGLGFAWEVYNQRHQTLSPPSDWMFVDRTEGYHTLWPRMQTLANITADEDLNLWVIAPGLRQKQYPQTLQVSGLSCAIDSNQYYRLGIPYQLYRCSSPN
jgi:uncharacterized membrane protein